MTTRESTRSDSTGSDPISYKDAGVDISAQNEALDRAKEKIRASFTDGVVGDVGLFGGLFDLAKAGARDAILVSSADGVGTKLEVARMAGVYDGVGRDLVQHCIGDILVQGARPLFFMDYANRRRLKLMARTEIVDATERPDLLEELMPEDYPATSERVVLYHVVAYDWNCPQHITPRYTVDELVASGVLSPPEETTE